MSTGMDLWDPQAWSLITTLAVLLAGMILANALRNVCKPIRQLMIPSPVLGGFILLFVNFICRHFFNFSLYSAQTLEVLTYHGLGLGFAALAFRKAHAKLGKKARTDAFNTGVTVVGGYLIQGVLGLLVTMVLFYFIGNFFASGLLLPMGYGQGPGQAYIWGHTYEVAHGFKDGTSFSLTIAAMGFVSASIGGIIHLNILRRKGLYKGSMGSDAHENVTLETFTGKNEVPLTESMDKFTIQVALVFIAYALSFLLMTGVNKLLDPTGQGTTGFINTIQNVVWGFQFLLSTLFAHMIKSVMDHLRKKGRIKREYANDFMQNRIAGFMFDLMVVASIAAIDLHAFTKVEFVLPLSIICVVGAVSTYFYLKAVCRRIFPSYEQEAFLSLYGMQTGTASTGTILLREMDPDFSSPAADNLVYHMPFAIAFGAPMFLLMGVAPESIGKCWMVFGACVGLLIIMMLILFRRQIFCRKAKASK